MKLIAIQVAGMTVGLTVIFTAGYLIGFNNLTYRTIPPVCYQAYEEKADGSIDPIGWKSHGSHKQDGTVDMVPERIYEPTCPDAYEIGGPKGIKDGWSTNPDTLETNARCWPRKTGVLRK
jgi:hypothetical protein